MVKRVNIDTLDEKIQTFLKSIQIKKDQYLLESNGKPVLGVVAPDEVQRIEHFRVLDRVWAKNKKSKADEVRKDVAYALKATANRII